MIEVNNLQKFVQELFANIVKILDIMKQIVLQEKEMRRKKKGKCKQCQKKENLQEEERSRKRKFERISCMNDLQCFFLSIPIGQLEIKAIIDTGATCSAIASRKELTIMMLYQ